MSHFQNMSPNIYSIISNFPPNFKLFPEISASSAQTFFLGSGALAIKRVASKGDTWPEKGALFQSPHAPFFIGSLEAGMSTPLFRDPFALLRKLVSIDIPFPRDVIIIWDFSNDLMM